METNDSVFNVITDDLSHETISVKSRRDVSCPFTNPDDWTFFFCFSTETRYKDVLESDDPDAVYLPAHDIRKMESFWEHIKRSGLIDEYSEIYECWAMPSPAITQYVKYRPLNHSSMEWAWFTPGENNYPGYGDEWAIWEVWIAVRINVFDAKLIWAFVWMMQQFVVKNISRDVLRSFYVYDMQGRISTDMSSLVFNEPRRNNFMSEDSWKHVTCDGESELKGEPVLFRTLQEFCTAHCLLKREATKIYWLELSRDEYLFNMKLTKCGFEADPLRSIEKRIHQQFARRIENVELQNMLSELSVSEDGDWASNKVLWRDGSRRGFADMPYAFYLRHNLSLQHLQKFPNVSDFARHVTLDSSIRTLELQDVRLSYILETHEGALCVLLWHGISLMPITTIFIGVVFERKDIERACDMLQFIYPKFDRDLFKTSLKQ